MYQIFVIFNPPWIPAALLLLTVALKALQLLFGLVAALTRAASFERGKWMVFTWWFCMFCMFCMFCYFLLQFVTCFFHVVVLTDGNLGVNHQSCWNIQLSGAQEERASAGSKDPRDIPRWFIFAKVSEIRGTVIWHVCKNRTMISW